jgi:hypothetical protein
VVGYFMTVPTGAQTTAKLIFRQSGILYQTVEKPFLLGRPQSLGFYDRAFGSWIPADAAAVSPDGPTLPTPQEQRVAPTSCTSWTFGPETID